jgi:hypothetical protein
MTKNVVDLGQERSNSAATREKSRIRRDRVFPRAD